MKVHIRFLKIKILFFHSMCISSFKNKWREKIDLLPFFKKLSEQLRFKKHFRYKGCYIFGQTDYQNNLTYPKRFN